MPAGIFITGSGTGVGKTFVSALMLRGFFALGYGTTYMKPVETGCGASPDGGMPAGSDTLYALGFASRKTDINLHSPYRFAPACSPHLAARENRQEINIERIASAYNNLIADTSADITIVEGAGGVLAPVNDREYMADIMKSLGIPAALVTGPGLGTLNHTFLSLRVLERYNIPVAGVVINNAQNITRDFIYEDNVETIRRYVDPAPCLDVDYNCMDMNERITAFCGAVIRRQPVTGVLP
jgi:dethiobiotin synthase